MTVTPAPAPDGQALEARLAEVLHRHIHWPGMEQCSCGVEVIDPGCGPDAFKDHLAAALTPIVAAEVERAVGEALDAAAVRIEARRSTLSPRSEHAVFAYNDAARVVREGAPR